jgi:hypothetical protein
VNGHRGARNSEEREAMSELVQYYRVNLYAVPGKHEGKIVLHCNNAHTLNLIFRRGDWHLSPNTFDVGTKTGTAYAPFAMYPHYLDLLRNEGPCRVSFILDTAPPTFRLQSSLEVPGEGEL